LQVAFSNFSSDQNGKKQRKATKDADSFSEAAPREVLAPPQVMEPSTERIEFESLFRRILHNEIAGIFFNER